MNQWPVYVLPVLTLQSLNFISTMRNVNVKLHGQFFCPLFSSFLIYMFFYFIICLHRHCICLQHSILCLFIHLFLIFPCFHLTYLPNFSASVFFFFFNLLIFSHITCHNFKQKFSRRLFSVQFSCLSND
jgi:hypothetical protein